jgi:CRISPR-associated protein Csx17
MSYHKHVLAGCAPTPLAHYLKALGILRLVAEQKDPSARGAWRDDRFVLLTTLTREELERFFLEEYRPTAIVSPWNKGSGFFQKNDPALRPIERSTSPRLASFRDGIIEARALLGPISAADDVVRAIKARTKTNKKAFQTKEQAGTLQESPVFVTTLKRLGDEAANTDLPDEERSGVTQAIHEIRGLVAWPAKPPTKAQADKTKQSRGYKVLLAEADRQFKALKSALVVDCGLAFRGSARAWMDAAMTLDDAGDARFPSLLGTGGNDGRLDFTNNFMQRLARIFSVASSANPTVLASGWLRAGLWGTDTAGIPLGGAIGQYLPGAAGGANSTTGPSGDSQVNPWDFVLMMEGAVNYASSVTRRLGTTSAILASAPFCLRSHSAGSGTMSEEEEGPRGEQWMPLWDRFLSLLELKSLLGEGRAQIGRAPASRPVDMARAVARLGVARGLSGFERYAYLQRNGKTHFAVPLGRIPVSARPRARLVDEIAPWLDRLHRAARGKGAPARLAQTERRLSDAVFEALTHDDPPGLWQTVLRAAVAIEQLQSVGTGIEAGLLPKLTPAWLAACDDSSPEFRLALALGSAASAHANGRRGSVDPIRHHWLPLTEDGRRLNVKDKRLAHDARVVAHGLDPEADLLAVLERRTIESTQASGRHPQITAAPGLGARPADLSAWLAGELDCAKVVELGRAFMAVDWERWLRGSLTLRGTPSGDRPDDAWCALRLNALPWPLGNNCDIPFDPAIARRLASGNLDEAVRLALRRLLAHGVRPTVRFGFGDPALARRWGAALSFPISHETALQLREQVDPQNKEPRHDR